MDFYREAIWESQDSSAIKDGNKLTSTCLYLLMVNTGYMPLNQNVYWPRDLQFTHSIDHVPLFYLQSTANKLKNKWLSSHFLPYSILILAYVNLVWCLLRSYQANCSFKGAKAEGIRATDIAREQNTCNTRRPGVVQFHTGIARCYSEFRLDYAPHCSECYKPSCHHTTSPQRETGNGNITKHDSPTDEKNYKLILPNQMAPKVIPMLAHGCLSPIL